MSNNQKSETCPNRRDFFLSFKFMFSKQAPPLFIGRPNNFQFNRKVSRENCKRCIWNEVRENILKQSWFIWIMGPHKLSFKKIKIIKCINLVQLTTAIATMCPKHARWDQKKKEKVPELFISDFHWHTHARMLRGQQQLVRPCGENIVNWTPAPSTSLSWLCVSRQGERSHVTSYKGSSQEPSQADVLLFKAEVHACLLYNI